MALAALLVWTPTTALAQTDFTLKKRAPARTADRYGDLPLGAVIRTDERYGHDGLFQGPRGWDYWNRLQNPQGYQNPNIWLTGPAYEAFRADISSLIEADDLDELEDAFRARIEFGTGSQSRGAWP